VNKKATEIAEMFGIFNLAKNPSSGNWLNNNFRSNLS